MYFEDDKDLIALLDQTGKPSPLPELVKIHDGVADEQTLLQVINRYSSNSPFAHHGHKAGQWVETAEDEYTYFLNCMPPLMMHRYGFVMCEPVSDDLHDAFVRVDDRYFYILIEWQGPQAFEDVGRKLIKEVQT